MNEMSVRPCRVYSRCPEGNLSEQEGPAVAGSVLQEQPYWVFCTLSSVPLSALRKTFFGLTFIGTVFLVLNMD